MNPTITKAAERVILVIAGLAFATLLVAAALVAYFSVEVDQAVLLAALVINGPTMGLLGLLANTRPSDNMIAAMKRSDPVNRDAGHADLRLLAVIVAALVLAWIVVQVLTPFFA